MHQSDPPGLRPGRFMDLHGADAQEICAEVEAWLDGVDDEALERYASAVVGRDGVEWERWERDLIFIWLKRRYWPALERFARCELCRVGCYPTPDDVHDVVQDVCGEGLCRVIENYHHDRGEFLGYLYRTLIYYCRRWARDRQRELLVGDDALLRICDSAQLACRGKSPEEEILIKEFIDQAIRAASPFLRKVLEMQRQDMSLQEIADSLGIQPGTLRVAYLRAMRVLRHKLGITQRRQL